MPQPFPLPPDATEFMAPAIYRVWWSEVERCSGRTAPLSGVRWYVSPRDFLELTGKSFVGGYYDHGGRRIVLAKGARYDGETVRHEILHALLGPRGGHPREPFLQQCAEFVGCGEDCALEAGPAPSALASAVRVTPDALVLGLTSASDTVRQSDDDAYVRATILVTNPLRQSIIVDVPSPDAGPPPSFGYDIDSPSLSFSNSDRVWDVTTLRFAPGETKRWQLDFKASELAEGENRLTGKFAARSTPSVRITVVP
ncbi:MAG: hypothetical protein IT355_07105 [Gemmatimonadaceae bacterium]|nr:hypothetical protein [Gemmatimonadaceae bacterium]